jgi:hypothetical protein
VLLDSELAWLLNTKNSSKEKTLQNLALSKALRSFVITNESNTLQPTLLNQHLAGEIFILLLLISPFATYRWRSRRKKD